MLLVENAEVHGAAPSVDRKSRILDAAEHCFVRNGFHKSTMQDVAAECGMSPGNLYRYFPSKDAIVAGLAERDRERFNADFIQLANAPDPAVAFVAIGRRHLVDEPRSKTIMMQEIWAEACRNPRMAEICAAMDQNVTVCMTDFIAHWRTIENAEGIGSPQEVAVLIIALADGLFRRRATDPAFEPSEAFRLALPVIATMVGVPLFLPSEILPSEISPSQIPPSEVQT
jgi:TetR/AcrR family transcriptional regulator, repressor for uid operon